MYTNPIIHHFWARTPSEGVSHCSHVSNIILRLISLSTNILLTIIIIFIIVTIISILILNSVPLDLADVANMGGADWKRGAPSRYTMCSAMQVNTLQRISVYLRGHPLNTQYAICNAHCAVPCK